MPRPPAAGRVWVRTVIVHGPQMEAELHREMPADWDMRTLREEIARGYGWPGFGMAVAWELNATGEPVRELHCGDLR